jgi:hypothetical protein
LALWGRAQNNLNLGGTGKIKSEIIHAKILRWFDIFSNRSDRFFREVNLILSLCFLLLLHLHPHENLRGCEQENAVIVPGFSGGV